MYDEAIVGLEYANIVISMVGLFLNSIVFAVFSRKKFQNLSFSFYFRVLLLVDSFALLEPLTAFSSLIFNKNFESISSFVCKLNEYYIYTQGSIATWIFTLISIDRFLTIVRPQRFPIMKKLHFQVVLVVLVVLLSACLYLSLPILKDLSSLETNSNNLSEFMQINISSPLSCSFWSTKNLNTLLLVNWIDLVNCLSSILINNVFMVLTLIFLFRSRKRVQRSGAANVRDQKFAINAIGVDLMNFLTLTPFMVTNIVFDYFGIDEMSYYGVFQAAFSLVYSIRASSYFWINLSLNSMFYTEFIAMIQNFRQSSGNSKV